MQEYIIESMKGVKFSRDAKQGVARRTPSVDRVSVTQVLIHRSHLFVSFRHRSDEQNPSDVTGKVVN